MSPSPNNVPQSPDRKGSSSALFNAFRNLTGAGRVKSSALASLPASPGLTTAEAAQIKSGAPAGSWLERTGSGANGSLSDKQTQGDAVSSPTIPRWKELVGGPPELAQLLERLDPARPVSERVDVIPQICRILDKFPVNNVVLIWNTASDLLNHEDATAESLAVQALLRSCVRLPGLTPIERNTFFNAIAQKPISEDSVWRLELLENLTNGGRNVEAFESSVAPFLNLSLQTCFVNARQARKLNRKAKAEGPLKEDQLLDDLFRFITNVTRFNGKIFRETDLETLLGHIFTICRETTREIDMQNSVLMFGTLVTYTRIPASSLRPSLEVLCDVHRQIQSLQEQTWTALANLLKSHIGPSSITVLFEILMDAPRPDGPTKNATRGALHVLQRLVLLNGNEGMPKVGISQLLPGLKASVTKEHRKLEQDVLEFVAAMLTHDQVTELLLEEDDWSDLVDALEMCARALDTRNSDVEAEEPTQIGRSRALSSASEPRPPEPPKNKNRPLRQIFRHIFDRLEFLYLHADFIQRASIMDLFMRLSRFITDSAADRLVKHYAEERLLHPSNPEWRTACQMLVERIFKTKTRPRATREKLVELLTETYNTIEGVYPDEIMLDFATMVLRNILDEEDTTILSHLVDFAVSITTHGPEDFFEPVFDLLRVVLEQYKTTASSSAERLSNIGLGSASNVVVKGVVRMFIMNLNRSGKKTAILYDSLLDVAKTSNFEADARLSALKLLFRVRCDSRHALFIIPGSECENMASVLCRTADTAVNYEPVTESTILEVQRPDEEKSTRDSRIMSSPSPHSSLTRHSNRAGYAPGRSAKPVPPLWMYPALETLPEEPNSTASTICFSFLNRDEELTQDLRCTLKLALWLEIVIGLLQREENWEVYSYTISHLGVQLANQSLFRNCVPQIRMLRSVLCDQIRSTNLHEPPSYTTLKKGDVAVCLYHVLTTLVSYHEHFEKSEEDDMVRMFLLGIGSWDRASKWCIHAISVCCHELPLSTSKSLGLIVQKMSEVITQPQLAVHILEFLAVLARLPELFYNFHEENYKTVFGVSFRYLQYARDQKERGTVNYGSHRIRYSGFGTLRHSSGSRELTASPEFDTKSRSKAGAEDLPQYLHALAYHVITFWFIALKLEDRKKYMGWITKNLIYRDRADREIIEEHAQVTIDMMEVFAYSDRDETAPDAEFAEVADGEVSKKTWIVGYSLLTIATAGRTGLSQITIRRASRTKNLILRPLLIKPPRHQVPIYAGLSTEAFHTSSYVGVLPDDIFQMFYSPLSFPSTLGVLREQPVALPADDMTARAINIFDRNTTVDNHKVGVVYVGDGQTNETEILANISGSADYNSFVAELGTLTRLKGAKFNTAGLDREFDSDGAFAYCWRDRCTEIVYHVATMMPTDPANDQTILRKKSHIGNDFVNIVFNNSGLPYKFGTIASQFNYVVIVITPEARLSFVETRLESDPEGKNRAYKVQVLCQPGFPEFSPAAVEKVVTGKHLAAYVRLIALNACFFSLVWAAREGGESISPWRNRLRDIKKLRERHCEASPVAAAPSPTPPSSSSGPFGPTFASPHPRDSGAAFKRTSVATFISEATSRSSILSGGATEMERSGSERSRDA